MIAELVLRIFESQIRPRIYRAYGRMLLRTVGSAGKNVVIHGPIRITDPSRLTIESHVRIGTGCFFFCKGGLSIGENTQISRNVTIYTGNHDMSGHAVPYDDQYKLASVRIGKSVWIGMNASVLPGVSIGDGAVIGLGTVVTKDVPPLAVVVGAGQRIVNRRDAFRFKQLLNDGRLFAVLWPDR
jgi:acetyltransferase-like isoleucine patch superfamily enzyme